MKTVPYIDEIWIISENGLTLYNEQFLGNDYGDLFGGFISAINAFASEIGMEEVQMIKGKNFKLTLVHYQDHRLSFVCRTPINQKDEKIVDYLNFLKEKFVDFYEDKIIDWKGDLQEFENAKELFNLEQTQLEIHQHTIFTPLNPKNFILENPRIINQISGEKKEKN